MNTSTLAVPNRQADVAQAEQDAVWSKISWRIVPVILVAYMMAFLDRINVGYAKLTMQQDLRFSEEVYGLGAGIFFITYLLFEVPSNLWLEKIGARLSFLRIMVLWGLTSAATAFVTTPTQFYIVRLLLGIFEAGFFPGIILYLTYWYPSARRGRITGLFLFGMPITGVIGGPLSGMIMNGFDGVAGWYGWQWLFVIEGIPTVLIGMVVYKLLADEPEQAAWLTGREKQVVAQVMEADRGPKDVSTSHGKLKAALTDPKTWILAFVYFTCACAVYTITFWLPTMIKGLGVTDVAQIGWYSAIPFGFGAIGILLMSRSSDRMKERRWHVASTLIVGPLALYGAQFMGGAFIPTMAMLSLASFFIFSCALFWSIPPTYLSREASATGIAVISSIGILGGFLSPTFIGWVKTATGSMNNGLLAITALIVIGGLTLLFAVPKSAMRVGGEGQQH
jgi:D-galactonate transporter